MRLMAAISARLLHVFWRGFSDGDGWCRRSSIISFESAGVYMAFIVLLQLAPELTLEWASSSHRFSGIQWRNTVSLCAWRYQRDFILPILPSSPRIVLMECFRCIWIEHADETIAIGIRIKMMSKVRFPFLFELQF